MENSSTASFLLSTLSVNKCLGEFSVTIKVSLQSVWGARSNDRKAVLQKESKWESGRNKEGEEKRYTEESSIDLECLEMFILVDRRLPFISFTVRQFLKMSFNTKTKLGIS